MAEWAASLRHPSAATPNKSQAVVGRTAAAPAPVPRRLAHKENVCPSVVSNSNGSSHQKPASKTHDDHFITDSDPPVHLMQLQQERLRAEVEKGFEEITQRANMLAQQRENIAREEEAIRQRQLMVEHDALDLDTRQADMEAQRDAVEAEFRAADERRARLAALERELQHRADSAERRKQEVAESEAYITERLGLRDEIRALEANVAEQRKQLQRREEELRQQEQALRDRTSQIERKEADIQELEEWTNTRHAQLARRKQELEGDEQRLGAGEKQALLDRVAALEQALGAAECFAAELQQSVGAELQAVAAVRAAAEAERLRSEQASVRRREDESSRTVSARVLELEGQVERHLGKEQHLQRCLDAAQAAQSAAQQEGERLLQQNALLQHSMQQLEERVAHYELAAAANATGCEEDEDEEDADEAEARRSLSQRSAKSDSRRSDAIVLAELRIDQLQAHLRSREQQLQDAVEQLQHLQAKHAAAAHAEEDVAALAAELDAARVRIAELEQAIDDVNRASTVEKDEAKSNEEELMRFAAAWEARAQELAGQVDQLQALIQEMQLSRERTAAAAPPPRPASAEGEAQTDAPPASSTAASGASVVFSTDPPADKECQFPEPIAPERRVVVIPPLALNGNPPIAPPAAHQHPPMQQMQQMQQQQPPLSGGRSHSVVAQPPLRSSTPTGRAPPAMGRPPVPAIQPEAMGRPDPNGTLNTAPGHASARGRSNSSSGGIIPMRSSTPRAVCRSLTPRFPDGTDATPFGELDVSEFCMASSDPKLAKVVKKQQKKLEKAMVKDAKRKHKESDRKPERLQDQAVAGAGQGLVVNYPAAAAATAAAAHGAPGVAPRPPLANGQPLPGSAQGSAIAPAHQRPPPPQPVIALPHLQQPQQQPPPPVLLPLHQLSQPAQPPQPIAPAPHTAAAAPAPPIAPDSGRQPRRADPESLFL